MSELLITAAYEVLVIGLEANLDTRRERTITVLPYHSLCRFLAPMPSLTAGTSDFVAALSNSKCY